MNAIHQVLILAVLFSTSPSHCNKPCEYKWSEFMPSAVIREDGSAWDPETMTLYPNGTYWFLPNSTIPMGCPCNLNRPCLRKCCQIGEVMDSSLRCISRNATYNDGGAWFRPELADNNGTTVLSVNGTKTKLGLLTEKPCSKMDKSNLVKKNFFIQATDAQLCIINKQVDCFEKDQFCIDYVEGEGDYLPVKCRWMEAGWTVKFTHTPFENLVVDVIKILTHTISSLALCIVLALYAYAPSLRTVHGKCHMCHAFCLLTYYSVQTLTLYSKKLLTVEGICYIIGPSVFYFHLAPLSWLNVMSADILMAFLNLRPVKSNLNGESRKFIIFSCYGWGIPLLAFFMTVIVDVSIKIEERPVIWCQKGRFRNWVYKTAVMYTLMIINMIIFAWTAVKIYMLKRESSMIQNQDSRRHSRDIDNSNNRTKMYLRLLLLMGFHWILEPVTKALHNIVRLDSRLGVRMIWYFIALVNRLQGLFILLMFIGNEKLTGVVWMKFSKSKVWRKLINQPSLKKAGISTISLNTFSGLRSARKSVDSTDTTENELSDTSRSDPMESPGSVPVAVFGSQSGNPAIRRMSLGFQLPTSPTNGADSSTNVIPHAMSVTQNNLTSPSSRTGSSAANFSATLQSSNDEIPVNNSSVSTIHEGPSSTVSSDPDMNPIEMVDKYKRLIKPQSTLNPTESSVEKIPATRKKSVSFDTSAALSLKNEITSLAKESDTKKSPSDEPTNENISDSSVIAIGIEESSNASDLLATSIV